MSIMSQNSVKMLKKNSDVRDNQDSTPDGLYTSNLAIPSTDFPTEYSGNHANFAAPDGFTTEGNSFPNQATQSMDFSSEFSGDRGNNPVPDGFTKAGNSFPKQATPSADFAPEFSDNRVNSPVPDGFTNKPYIFKVVANSSVGTEPAKARQKSTLKFDDPFPYYHTKRLLNTYNFRRIGAQIYVYDPVFGTFQNLDDNQLKTIIRKGWDEETQIMLSRFNVTDIMDRLRSDSDCLVTDDFFDCDEYLINFLNGTLDIHTGKLHEHSIEFAQTTVLNAEFHADSQLNGSLFEKFITHICGENSVKLNHLQEILGFMLSNFTKVKKAIVFDGVRHSSKSTLLRIMENILGSPNISHFTLSELGKRFVSGKLMDRKINICGERGAGLIRDLETFKMITGGDWCESENKGKDFTSKPAKTKLVFAGNFLPNFENEDDSTAFIDRSTLFIFQNPVPENRRIIDMDRRLLNERDLIVSWAMDGLKRLIENNFMFSEAEDAKLIRQSRVIQTNPLDDFLTENCIFQQNARAFSTDLYSRYRRYCYNNALTALSQREFITEVIAKTESRGVIHKKIRIGKSGPYLGFDNMGLKEDDLLELEEQRNSI